MSQEVKIRMTIELSEAKGGGVGIFVATEPFDALQTAQELGCAWIGLCHAINKHMHETGSPEFDCLKSHREN